MVQLSVRWLRLTTQLVSLATLTDWKVVPKAIVPMGKISVYDCSAYDIVGLRQLLSGWRSSLCLAISYLVDPASSHMLVSKIKPCMSKYKPN